MKKLSILATAALSATFAQPALAATTFEGTATVVSLNESDPGLKLYATPLSFSTGPLEVGELGFFNVLTIGTTENSVTWFEDTDTFDIELGFDFTSPLGVSDTHITGTTRGTWIGSLGVVQWNSPISFTFGDTGEFKLWLFDTAFTVPGETTVTGKIKLLSEASENAGAVPEPATWGMMLAGFGALGLAMRRRARAVSFA